MSAVHEKSAALKLACAIVAESDEVYVTHEELHVLSQFKGKPESEFLAWMTKMGVPCLMRKGKPMKVVVKDTSNSASQD